MRDVLARATAQPRRVGLALAGALTVIIGTSATLASASPTHSSAGMTMGAAKTSANMGVVGDTLGWFNGKTVDLHYTKNFFCKSPPASKAASNCELGAEFTKKPSRHFDPLYVLVPIGFTPGMRTLQCPVAGNCVDHPHTIDLTRVFGAGTGNVKLPAHSHVISDLNAGKAEWWDVEVIGVSKPSSWNTIVNGKSLQTVRMLQKHKSSGVTGDIPTNLFLFFSSRTIK